MRWRLSRIIYGMKEANVSVGSSATMVLMIKEDLINIQRNKNLILPANLYPEQHSLIGQMLNPWFYLRIYKTNVCTPSGSRQDLIPISLSFLFHR